MWCRNIYLSKVDGYYMYNDYFTIIRYGVKLIMMNILTKNNSISYPFPVSPTLSLLEVKRPFDPVCQSVGQS